MFKKFRMNLLQALRRIRHDDRGGEVLEWALIAGGISIVCLVLIGSYGSKVLARWQSVNTSM